MTTITQKAYVILNEAGEMTSNTTRKSCAIQLAKVQMRHSGEKRRIQIRNITFKNGDWSLA